MAEQTGGSNTGENHVPVEAVQGVFQGRVDRARPLTASDIMEAVSCSRRTAHNKLNELTEQGVLETRKVGSRSRVWWVPIEDGGRGPQGDPRAALLDDVELPGTGSTLREREDALLAVYDYLRAHPRAKKSDFQTAVYPDHDAGFETAEGWWNALQPALAELPGVDPPKERGHIWKFTD